MVNTAIETYKDQGRDEAFKEVNDLLVGDSYVFVLDETGLVVAVGSDMSLIGTTSVLATERDEDGVILLDRATAEGAWVSYPFKDPISGAELPKESFIRSYDGYIFGSGYYDTSGYRTDAENVQAVVNAAINKYQELGREESFEELNGLLVGDSYAFVVDPEREIVVAHGANAARIGQPTILSTERDEEGVKLLDRATEAGDWVTYIFEDPVSGAELPKESFIRLYDGLVFGSGYYDRSGYRTDAENVQAVVNAAINKYQELGREESFMELNGLLVGDSYAFVVDPDMEIVVAHGANAARIGQPTILSQRDEEGVKLLDRATEAGDWVTYIFEDPVSGAQLPKESFIRLYDGLVFGSGYYDRSGYRTDAENVQAVVDAAISNYQELGREESFNEINGLLVGDSYAFVVERSGGIVVAHGADMSLLGMTSILSIENESGVTLLEQATEDGAWVSYVFNDPVSGVELPKRSFLRLYDGLVFGSGYYDRSGYRTDAENVQAVVTAAISSYQELGREESFMELNGLLVGDSYAFVVERSGGIVVAHGADMSLLGMTSLLSIEDESGVTLLEQATEDGAWVSYVFNDPVSGAELPKRSFLRLYDGLVFGSGYYDRSGYRTDAENVQAVVDAAITNYQELGREESFNEINGLLVGDSYAFVVEQSGGIVVAHGADMSLLGMSSLLSIEDESGMTLLEQATEDGAWVSYVFNDPVSGAELPKRSFLRLYDGLVFGSGYYDRSGYRTDAENVQAVVDAAISNYQELGREESFSEINGLLVGDSYAFVVERSGGIVVAHGADMSLLGMTSLLSVEDESGVTLLEQATEDGAWVSYVFNDPVSGVELPKRSFLRLYDGLVFGSGYYDRSGYRTDADNVQAVVTAAISSYQELGREESFMELNGLLVGDSYAFVVDPEREVVVAHGANADRIGQPTILSSERDDEGVKLLDRATEAGDWVTYLFEDPVSGAELPKISFIRLYDGLVFGSGYYDTSDLDN